MTDLELKLTGDLGRLDFGGALETLQRAYRLLMDVQRQVLGARSEHVRWVLTGLREGSAVTLLRGEPAEADVSEDDLGAVVDAYTSGTAALARGAAEPPAYFDADALTTYRDLAKDLRRFGVGDLVASAPGREPVIVRAAAAPPAAVGRLDERFTVRGSVIGRIDAINVHDKREVALWSELDNLRVRVTFPESLYAAVHAALRQRVGASGELTEDAFGRPLSLRLEDLDVLPGATDLPSLASLVGSIPDLTGGQPPSEWLAARRRSMGVG